MNQKPAKLLYWFYTNTRTRQISIFASVLGFWQGATRLMTDNAVGVGILSNDIYSWLLLLTSCIVIVTNFMSRIYRPILCSFANALLSALYIMLGVDVLLRDSYAIILALALLFYGVIFRDE